jgi:hypothetical protein
LWWPLVKISFPPQGTGIKQTGESYMHAQEAAEALALRALVWILGDDDRRAGFLAATGVDPGDLSRGARDPGFLGAVLDFLLSDEPRVIAFCTEEGLAFDAPMRARAALPGGEVPHWT